MQKLLLNLTDSADFQKLSRSKKKFNIFNTGNARTIESRYLEFLYWLLDPKENHALGDMFFKKLLKALSDMDNEYLPLLYADISDLEVKKEPYYGTSIYAESGKNKTVFIINNNEKMRWIEEYERRADYKRYISENYHRVFLYLTPERIRKNNMRNKGYIKINYGVICNIIDEVLKEKDGNMDNKTRFLLIHYKESLEENIMKNVGAFDMAVVCRQIYLEHKEAIDSIVKYGKPYDFAGILFREILNESELFEYIDGENVLDMRYNIYCLPYGIDDAVKEKLLFTNKSKSYPNAADYGYRIIFSLFKRKEANAYFGLIGNSYCGDKYMAYKDSFRKSLENELNIKILPKRNNEVYLNEDEPLFSLDILNAGNAEEIKAEMKKRFEEKCVPYIEKFVSAINKAEIV